MKPPLGPSAIQEVIGRLAELLDLAPVERSGSPVESGADAILDLGGYTFVIEWKGSGAAAHVAMAAEQVRRHAADLDAEAVPLVAVPFMGPVGRARCEDAGVGWLDLSGNARIVAPGVRVLIEGQPNRFKGAGRPLSAFAPKSARIARWLLMHPDTSMTQREIARATVMDEGFTSRIVARLEDDNLIVRDSKGAIRVRDPNLLLDAWSEDYDFSKHRILGAHLAARSGDSLLRLLVQRLTAGHVQYAVTGLAAAWLFTKFAGFRIVTVYASEQPQRELLEVLGLREEERGANVWLVAPNDEGVLHGAADHDGVRCVHPVQAYLDLRGHPERSKEAADELRAQLLTWRSDG